MKLLIPFATVLLPLARACYDAKDVQLEVVLLQPMYDLGKFHWMKRESLEYSVQNTGEALNKKFPRSKYTLSSFQDYSVPGTHNACYRHYEPIDVPSALTKSLDALLADPYCSESLSNGKWESSLSAVALAATRPQDTHFSGASFTETGKRVVRFIVVISGGLPYQRGQAPEVMGRAPFPTDGSGTCSFEPPTMQQVATVLDEKDVQLLVLATKDTLEWWQNQGRRFFGTRISVREIEDVLDYQGSQVTAAIEEQLCYIESTSTSTAVPPAPTTTYAPDVKCYQSEDIQLQLVIHQPFHDLEGLNLNSFHLRKTLDAYKDVIEANYKGADYTIVGFEDYETLLPREGCWYPGYPFSRAGAYDLSLASIWASTPGQLIDPLYESSLTALALTATRTDKLQFAQGAISPEGKPYVKVLALVAGARPYLSGQLKPNAPSFTADGTADCDSDAPTLEQFRDIMVESDLRLVVLAYGEGYKWWSTVGKELLGSRMVIQEVDSIFKVPASDLTKLIAQHVCPAVPSTSTSTTVPATSAQSIRTMSPTPSPPPSTSSTSESNTVTTTTKHQTTAVVSGISSSTTSLAAPVTSASSQPTTPRSTATTDTTRHQTTESVTSPAPATSGSTTGGGRCKCCCCKKCEAN